MEEQLISFETAKLAKEKGFNALCYDAFNSKGNLYSNGWCEYLYDNKVEIPFRSGVLESKDVLAPTQSLLAKWLREKHDIHFEIKPIFDVNEIRPYHISISKNLSGKNFKYKIIGTRETYEEALKIGLQEALKLIK